MNKIIPRTLPGTMELLPKDQILFNDIKNKIINVYEKYGFLPLDTPIIEASEVLLAKGGGETEKQIYRFKKGESDISLRFDLTVPLAKYVSANYGELVFPFKRYQIGKVYRGERNQKGRYREFYQSDIDIICEDNLPLINDAIMPSVINDIFNSINIGKFIIKINNRKILNGVLEYLNIDNKVETLRIIDKYDKVNIDELKSWLDEIKENISDFLIPFINTNGSNDEIINELKRMSIDNDTFNEGVNELETVINYMKELEIPETNYKIDLKVSRGLDYYTGTVYETNLVDYPSLGSICSGGRYDNLVEYYTDKQLPGVGISIGLTRLFYQLLESKIIEPKSYSLVDALVVPMSNDLKYSLKITKLLRDNNLKIDLCTIDKGFKQKLNYANKLKIQYVIIVGEDEENNNYVTIKNMNTGIQDKVDYNKILDYFKNIKKS